MPGFLYDAGKQLHLRKRTPMICELLFFQRSSHALGKDSSYAREVSLHVAGSQCCQPLNCAYCRLSCIQHRAQAKFIHQM